MNKVLCTFGWGEASKWLEFTGPLMMKYAMMHGYDFYVERVPSGIPDSWITGKDASPRKLYTIDRMLYNNEVVLWLDADVVIKKFDTDILQCVNEQMRNEKSCNGSRLCGWSASAVHQTDAHGLVPNCGVWLVGGGHGVVDGVLCEDSKLEDSLWEQARYCKRLGGNDQFPMSFPNGFPSWFQELPYEWNVTLWDKRGIPGNLRFFHATASRDPEEKLALIKEWVEK